MAKKRLVPKDSPSFFVVQPDQKTNPKPKRSSRKKMVESLDDRPEVSLKYLLEFFNEMEFNCEPLNNESFLVINDEMQAVTLHLHEEFHLISVGIPLKFKSGLTKSKKLDWLNIQMTEFPFIRLGLNDDGTALMSFEYLYLHTFDEATFIGMFAMVVGLMYEVLEIGEQSVLKKMPRFTPDDFE